MKRIILVTVDFDHPDISVQIVNDEEREDLDDSIELDGGKEVNSFEQFLKEVDIPDELSSEMDDMKQYVEKLLTSHQVLESFAFPVGELGSGFYAVVNDENNVLDVDLFLDFV